MRVFVDDGGVEWVVWEVRPEKVLFGRVDRRVSGDRRVIAAPDPVIERRRLSERRLRERRLAGARDVVGVVGWLAFQSGTTRRRLVPVPFGWREMSDAELSVLCRRAAPAPRGTPVP
jgi:hypothetical protein